MYKKNVTALLQTNVLGGEPLGMENGTIPDENITASSSASAAPPHLGRLNGLASWCTGKADGCYLQVRLTSIVKSHYRVSLALKQCSMPSYVGQSGVK